MRYWNIYESVCGVGFNKIRWNDSSKLDEKEWTVTVFIEEYSYLNYDERIKKSVHKSIEKSYNHLLFQYIMFS